MEITNSEVQAVKEVVRREDTIAEIELSELHLSLVGGGINDPYFA
jgi:hypothetical protein